MWYWYLNKKISIQIYPHYAVWDLGPKPEMLNFKYYGNVNIIYIHRLWMGRSPDTAFCNIELCHQVISCANKMSNCLENKATRSPEISRQQVQKLTPQFFYIYILAETHERETYKVFPTFLSPNCNLQPAVSLLIFISQSSNWYHYKVCALLCWIQLQHIWLVLLLFVRGQNVPHVSQ